MSRRPDSDSIFWQEVAPILKEAIHTAEDIAPKRIEQTTAVPSAVERQAVRQFRAQIAVGLEQVAQGADPMDFFTQLVKVMAEGKQDSPRPFLSRVDAVRAVGRLYQDGKLPKDPTLKVWGDFILAKGTEPFPHGSVILDAAFDASRGLANPAYAAAGKIPGKVNAWDQELPTSADEDQRRITNRAALYLELLTDFNSLGNKDVPMDLKTWYVIEGQLKLGRGYSEGGSRPKWIVKLGPRRVEVSPDDFEICPTICSENAQMVVAALGAPTYDRFNVDVLEERNLAAIFGRSAVVSAEPGQLVHRRWRGIRMPALDIPDENTRNEIQETLDKTGCMPLSLAVELLPADTLPAIVAIRASRKLEDKPSDHQVYLAQNCIRREVDRIREPFNVEIYDGDELREKKEVSILGKHAAEFNQRGRGGLSGRRVTEAETADYLITASLGWLLGVDPSEGIPAVRSEKEILQVLGAVIQEKGIAEEDLKAYPDIFPQSSAVIDLAHDIKIETVRREATPLLKTPPVQITKKERK